MKTRFFPIPHLPAAEPSQCEQELLPLLVSIEASLAASQQAILCRDVARLEQLTLQQNDLAYRLLLWQQDYSPRLEPDAVRQARTRIVHQAQIHLALLERADRRVRAVASLAVGPQTMYAHPRSATLIPGSP